MERSAGARRVGYVVSRFPKLSETFVLREMDALEAEGHEVVLYPLLGGESGVVHPDARPWLPRARRTRLLSAGVLLANARALRRDPVRYLSVWAAVVRGYAGDRSLPRAVAVVPASVALADRVREDGVPHLHAHFATYPLLAAWVVHRLTGTSYSVTVHAHDLFTGTPMLARKLRDARFVVAISEYNRDFLGRVVDPALPARTAVVHCGVDVARYARRHRPADDVLDVLCVGSLQEYKGHRFLVEACALLRAREVRVRCRIVGEGALRGRLEATIRAAGLSDVVQLLGARTEDEVTALLGEADVYAQPSIVAADGQMEGIPVALMEALASRLPVVATALSGVPELVRDGETGWLVPPSDAEALATALADVAARPQEAARRAEAGHRLVAQQFDLHANVRQLADLLEGRAPVGEAA